MKKLMLVFLLIIATSAFLAAEADSDTGLKIKIAESMKEFSRAYIEKHPDPVTKQGIAVMAIENNSEKATTAKIGELVRAYIEEAMDRSLIFVLTDRANLDKILDEIKFSASGMVSGDSAVEIGEITGTAALVSGSVAEEGSDFRIQLKLTEIETGEVLTVFGFSLPQKELIDASTEYEYGFVAANGIGLSAKPFSYIYGADTFNNFKPMYMDTSVKYRLSRDMMLSAGIMVNLITEMDLYRWDPSQYSFQDPVLYGDVQPELPIPGYLDSDISQITGALSDGTAFHVDFQYTLNFSPNFNIGISAGLVSFFRPVLSVLYGSSGDLYYDDSGYDATGPSSSVVAQRDNMPMEYVFNPLLGGKLEISPEFFITHRLAVTLTAGYIYTFPAGLREVIASEGQWAYYAEAVASNYSQTAIDKYYGFNPINAPGGGTWTLDMSGFYGGIAVSVFF